MYVLKKTKFFLFSLFILTATSAVESTAQNSPFSSYEKLVSQVNPAVVQLTVEGYGNPRKGGLNQSSLLSRELQTGSGVIVDSTGYIITNTHVVSGARTVRVLLTPQDKYNPQEESVLRPEGNVFEAEIIGMDQETDVALLKINNGNYPYLKFGDSDELRPGQRTFAFGSPLGLENSVSMGIISSTARQLKPEDPMIYIQTDAPINPGNSGGPLVNTDGEIVGINTLNMSVSGGSQGLGFAAPSNIVKDIYKQLRKRGSVQRGVIGAYAQTINPTLAQAINLKKNYRVILSDVYPGSPADQVGLKPGDIIISMDGKFMENARQMNVNIYGKELGSYINLRVYREGNVFKRRVKVIERDDQDTQFMNFVDPEKNFVERLGILAVDATGKVRNMLPSLRKRGGILVAASNGKADVLGDPFKPGDVIYRMNGEKVSSFSSFKQQLNSFESSEQIYFQVERQGTLRYLSHELK